MNQYTVEADLVGAVEKELTVIAADPANVIGVRLTKACALAFQLQLALKHPQNTGAGAAIAREFVNKVDEALTELDMPALREMLRRGWESD